MEFTLNKKLLNAFHTQNYRECETLIEQGADKQVIFKAYQSIKPSNRTMSHDSIIENLVL